MSIVSILLVAMLVAWCGFYWYQRPWRPYDDVPEALLFVVAVLLTIAYFQQASWWHRFW